MKDFLTYIVSQIIDNPEDLSIEETEPGENIYQYTIATDKNDMGKVIGKSGKIIQAIRNLAKIIAIKDNRQVRIELKEIV
jgi:predicted RNA-binding protein YlqC (UPF0109 family)